MNFLLNPSFAFLHKLFIGAYQPQKLFDAASCQTAVFLLYTALIIFMGMTYAGFYLFFKSVAGRRMPELALYTSMGYPAAALGEILFTEYIPLGGLFLLVICRNVLKRSAQIDLTVLLRER